MDAQRWAVIESVYHAALGKEPGERSSYLAAACADDPRLRSEIESLLAYADAHLSSPSKLPKMAEVLARIGGIAPSHGAEPAEPTAAGTAHTLPAAVGRYRILRLLGEGGMGFVYEAEQEQPRRTVALKVIKPGSAGAELLRRFAQESEALGRLQHPGIAQIYEAGAADTGFGPQPYFAMELIRGQSLLEYAKAHELNIRQRLEMMVKVCEAVHHAHQRGIIHRDLKPGNILVDESGQPKVLDFGVARVTDSDAEARRQTDAGRLVGTLAYMSPEQVLADPLELDTRSDVYSLGVILYELLAGRLPYTVSRNLPEAVQTIREQDPARLSSVSRTYRGDIETIVAKALEKNKARRYASAAGLAGDIRQYLADEPILARPPSATYQLQKFAHRHKAIVAGAAAVFVVLTAGVIVSTWEAARANRESATAKAVNDFLQNDLLAQASANTQARPDRKPDPDLKVRTALDRAAVRIEGRFGKQPLVEASIRETIGKTYEDLGLYPEAQQQLERAIELRRRVLGEVHPDTLAGMQKLAALYQDQGKYAQAEPLFTKILEARRRVFGEAHRDTLATMSSLADLCLSEGKYAQAEPLLTKGLELQRRLLGEEHIDTLASMNNLAGLYRLQGKYAQAEPLLIKVVELEHRVLGEDNPDTLSSMNNLAVLYRLQGHYAEAEPLFTKVLGARRRVLGEEHPDTLLSMNTVAQLYQNQGDYPRAEPLFTKVLEVRRRLLGEEHPNTLNSMSNLAMLYRDQGKYGQAEPLSMKVLEVRRRVLSEEHPDTLLAVNSLAVLYRDQGRFAQAEPLFTRALESSRRILGDGHPETLNTMGYLAILYRDRGDYVQAEPLFTKVLEAWRRMLGESHPTTLNSMSNLAALYVNQGKYARAEALLREALNGYKKTKNDSWGRYSCQSLLGASLAGQKKYPEAEELLLSGYKGMQQREACIPAYNRFRLKETSEMIFKLYQDWGKPEKGPSGRARCEQARLDLRQTPPVLRFTRRSEGGEIAQSFP